MTLQVLLSSLKAGSRANLGRTGYKTAIRRRQRYWHTCASPRPFVTYFIWGFKIIEATSDFNMD